MCSGRRGRSGDECVAGEEDEACDDCVAGEAGRGARRGESRADNSLFEPGTTRQNYLPDQCWSAKRARTIPA